MKRTISSIALILFFGLVLQAQNNKKYLKIGVGFYNLENLFDTIHQEGVRDDEFTPNGANRWTAERYERKLKHLSEAISQMAGRGPSILGISEVENIGVVEDLIKTPELQDMNYGIVHYDSPDARGIDVALLYQKHVFTLHDSKTFPVKLEGEPNFKTRDILLASGDIDGEMFHFMVAHWPSRLGGEKASEYRRMAAAKVMRHVADSLLNLDRNAKIIMMGDLNDDPVNNSVRVGLNASGNPKKLTKDTYFCPMYKLYKDGYGTLAYRDSWNLFDNMIVSPNLLGNDFSQFRLFRDSKSGQYAYILNKSFLTQKEGRYKGYPWRTIVGGQYQGGYSDHFPVYLYIVKELK
jgi:hypothetical protein